MHQHPNILLPMRLPQFLYNLKNQLFPKYFIYSLISTDSCQVLSRSYKSSSKNVPLLESNKTLGKQQAKSTKKQKNIKKYPEREFAKAAIQAIRNEPNKSEYLLIWACIILFAYHWKYKEDREMEYLIRKPLLFCLLKNMLIELDLF
ncbi:hypothetical protein AYI68_g6674 [Smittium mucronatum]|uniref:Uncharacterized protein n=1 Tax=Smittium mucronatum TaxID=133383 RepID=A0A1R0GQV2_9FUNG|nr:hypothetical protein AYI68_g6674 [Smittium mucronatum]